ncbi:MAG TPA: hypothetical protein VFI39_07530 [Gemmatimonadales bacterium]|nr:hypothetical protein [Gemmatimonadales bacterium]
MDEIERQVMTMLLAGTHPTLAVLRAQYEAATVVGRAFTGVGVFTDFVVPPNVPRTEPHNVTFGDVAFELEGTENGGSVVLFVRDGALKMLELFNWTDKWPETPALRTITYMAVKRRLQGGGKEVEPASLRDVAELERELA